MLFRVFVSCDNIRRVDISENLDSVEQLKNILKERLELVSDFLIQFEDPDFGNELCNLTNIMELPQDKAVLRILYKVSGQPEDVASVSSMSTMTSSSESLPSTSANQGTTVQLMQRDKAEQWPSPFPVPLFSDDVELRLAKGNELFSESGALLTMTREMKMDILNSLAQAIFSYKAYPKNHEIESVAAALIEKHPCLKDPGIGTGYHGWVMSIKYKLGNYRQKLRMAGSEVTINQKSTEEKKKGIKKAKKCEVNFLPDNPAGETAESLERERQVLEMETRKSLPNKVFIDSRMEVTFAVRRKEIVDEEPVVADIMKRWPGLFVQDQICAEFFRITRVELMKTFLSSLDLHSAQLIKLYRSRSGKLQKDIRVLLDCLDEQTTDVLAYRKSTALRGLPLFLKERPDGFLKTCVDTDPEDLSVKGVELGILTVVEDDVGTVNSAPTTRSIALVIEEQIVLDDISDLPTAFALFFGLTYALNLDYPKELKYTFEAVQKVFLNLGTHCSARVQALKNSLLK